MCYPNDFWRGVSSEQQIHENHANSQAFTFKENPERNDNYFEMSINWNDDPQSIEVLLKQRKANGDIQFKMGAVNIELKLLKRCLFALVQSEKLSYERASIPENEYHGNLLLRSDVSKQDKTMISNALAALSMNNGVTQNCYM